MLSKKTSWNREAHKSLKILSPVPIISLFGANLLINRPRREQKNDMSRTKKSFAYILRINSHHSNEEKKTYLMPVKLQLAAIWSTSSLCGGWFSSVICASLVLWLVTLTNLYVSVVTVLTLCTFGTAFSSFFNTVLLGCSTLNAYTEHRLKEEPWGKKDDFELKCSYIRTA